MQSLIVCGENFVNQNAVLTLSSGDAYKARLFDNDRGTRCPSIGSSEGASWTVEINFADRRGAGVSRTFDRLVILNHNLKNFYFEYWDAALLMWTGIGGTFYTAGNLGDNAATDNYFVLDAPISSTAIRLTATNTIGAVAEKLVGEIMCCAYVTDVRHIVTIERNDWDDGGNYRLDSGALVTFMRSTRFESKVSMDQVTLATYTLLEPLLRERQPMVWILHSDFRAADVFSVVATSQPQTTLDAKMELYSIGVEVKGR